MIPDFVSASVNVPVVEVLVVVMTTVVSVVTGAGVVLSTKVSTKSNPFWAVHVTWLPGATSVTATLGKGATNDVGASGIVARAVARVTTESVPVYAHMTSTLQGGLKQPMPSDQFGGRTVGAEYAKMAPGALKLILHSPLGAL